MLVWHNCGLAVSLVMLLKAWERAVAPQVFKMTPILLYLLSWGTCSFHGSEAAGADWAKHRQPSPRGTLESRLNCSSTWVHARCKCLQMSWVLKTELPSYLCFITLTSARLMFPPFRSSFFLMREENISQPLALVSSLVIFWRSIFVFMLRSPLSWQCGKSYVPAVPVSCLLFITWFRSLSVRVWVKARLHGEW